MLRCSAVNDRHQRRRGRSFWRLCLFTPSSSLTSVAAGVSIWWSSLSRNTSRTLFTSTSLRSHSKARYTLATKSKGRSTFGRQNYPLSTKSTGLNMFNSVDNVDRNTVDKVERAGDSRLSTNRRQIGDKVDSRLCRQCLPGYKGLSDINNRVLKICVRRTR